MNGITGLYALLAAGAGACIALQASANGKFRENLNSPIYAAAFSICGTIVTASLFLLAVRPSLPAWDDFKATQWWNWIGGPLGALIVLAGAYLARELGAAAFIALVVGGQLVCALVLDHFALLGLPQQSINPWRIVGVVLVVAGVVCIKFLGSK